MRLPGLVSIFMILLAAGCDEIAERSWCTEVCEKLRECSDAELGVGECADRCDEAVDDGEVSESGIEDCANCVEDTTCRDVPSDCRVCEDLLPDFTSRSFE